MFDQGIYTSSTLATTTGNMIAVSLLNDILYGVIIGVICAVVVISIKGR